MSMSLLYNIEKFNNTVTIQSSVSMYTDVYMILSFSITKGVTRPVSSDLKTQFFRHFELPWRSPAASVHVFVTLLPAVSDCTVYVNSQPPLSMANEQGICYFKLRHIHIWIHLMKIRSRLHVM